jgi:hypothetical protein
MSTPTRAEVQEALRKVRAAIFQASFAFDEANITEARAAARRAAIAVTELEIVLAAPEENLDTFWIGDGEHGFWQVIRSTFKAPEPHDIPYEEQLKAGIRYMVAKYSEPPRKGYSSENPFREHYEERLSQSREERDP